MTMKCAFSNDDSPENVLQVSFYSTKNYLRSNSELFYTGSYCYITKNLFPHKKMQDCTLKLKNW